MPKENILEVSDRVTIPFKIVDKISDEELFELMKIISEYGESVRKEILEEIEKEVKEITNPYPNSVFGTFTKKDKEKLAKLVEKEFGFPIDRVSADYGRWGRGTMLSDVLIVIEDMQETNLLKDA